MRPAAEEECESTSEELLINLGQSATGTSEEIGTNSVSGDQSGAYVRVEGQASFLDGVCCVISGA